MLIDVPLGEDASGAMVKSAVVEWTGEGERAPQKPKAVPAAQRLLMTVVAESVADAGETFRAFGPSGPMVKGAADSIVRARFYKRIAEVADPKEDPKKIADRQRQAFNRAIADAIKAQRLVASQHNGERFVWLP